MSRMVESLDVLRLQHMNKACAGIRSAQRTSATRLAGEFPQLAGECREIAARAAVSPLQSSRHG
jgi:hypothetical protein